MKKLLLLLLLTGVIGISAKAQTKKEAKVINKSYDIFLNKDIDKGIEKLREYMNKLKNDGKVDTWPSVVSYDYLVEMEYIRYLIYLEEYGPGMDLKFIDDDETDTSYTIDFGSLMTSVYEITLKSTCKMSTLESRSQRGDMYYRKLWIDDDPDTNISDRAEEYYAEAEEFYAKEDYELAELNYRKALDEEPLYYKAMLYLGDTFWAREDYDSAIVYFSLAKDAHPHLLEPRKYIVEALVGQELYFRAKKECLETFCVFPGFDMKGVYNNILSVENKYLDDHRLYRDFGYNNTG